MFDCGHDTPLKNKIMSEKNKKTIIPVSLFGKNTETVIEKKIVASKNGNINFAISNKFPM